MLNMNKDINFSASSKLDDGTILANMTASITNDGIFNMNKYTVSKEAYAEHSETIETDFAKFEEMVNKYAQSELIPTGDVTE